MGTAKLLCLAGTELRKRPAVHSSSSRLSIDPEGALGRPWRPRRRPGAGTPLPGVHFAPSVLALSLLKCAVGRDDSCTNAFARRFPGLSMQQARELREGGGTELRPVFVTVGTTRFDALIREVSTARCQDELLARGYTQLLVQKGKGSFSPPEVGQRGLLMLSEIPGECV